ncbi:MAG TPA: MFS transporter [Streptosporangiaceae bacterium]
MSRDRAGGSPARGGPGGAGLRENRNWRWLWLGQAVSLTGDSVFDITVMLWVATVLARGRPWAPAAASGVLIAEAAPVLVVAPVAGVLVDRWNRRRVMMGADAFRAVLIAALIAGLLVLPAPGHGTGTGTDLAVVYAVVAAQSAAAQFFNPCRLATLGRIVTPAGQPAASGMLQATMSMAMIIGEPLGAGMLTAFGVRWALLLNAISFGVSFLAVRAIRVPDDTEATGAGETPRGAPSGARARAVAEFREGIRFFAGNRVVLAICSGVTIATLGMGALNTLLVFFVTGNLHAAPGWLGVLAAAFGAGSVLGALLSGRLAVRIGAGRVFCLGLIGGGLMLAAYSRMTWLAPALALDVLTGLLFGALTAAVGPLVLAQVPQRLIGRVMSVFSPLQQTANIASMVAAGLLAGTVLRGMRVVVAGMTFQATDTIFGAGALLIVAAGCAVLRPLRNAPGPAAGHEPADQEVAGHEQACQEPTGHEPGDQQPVGHESAGRQPTTHQPEERSEQAGA